jgi:hypothetical protein
MFGALLTEPDGDFCLVASALDLNDNTFAKDGVHHVITRLEVNEVVCIARFGCRADSTFGATPV